MINVFFLVSLRLPILELLHTFLLWRWMRWHHWA